MQISRPLAFTWLPFLVLLTACSDGAAGSVPGSTGDTSTGESPGTPTSAGPSSSGESSSSTSTTSTSSTGDTGAGSTEFADPGPICGDGIQGPNEGCDDGEGNDSYGWCTEICELNICGDGKVLVGIEGCDQGALNLDTGYCRSDCLLGVCGDGFLFTGVEECDAVEPTDGYGKCDANCTINRCGDGHLDSGFEECDEGPDNGVGEGERGKVGCDLECGLAGRRMFLSSKQFTGNLGTRVGADLACQNMAKAADFKRYDRFRALLADADTAPADFVIEDPAGRPFILPSGLILTASFAELLKSGPGDGVTMTETGETLHAQWVWTNLNVAGTAYLDDAASTCADWSSADVAKTARVGRNAPPPGDAAALAAWMAQKKWLSEQTRSCKYAYRIYCIEAT